MTRDRRANQSSKVAQGGIPFRYMGTKRALAPAIASAIRRVKRNGSVLDLFGGMGAVATQFIDEEAVHINDKLKFTNAISASRYCDANARVTNRDWKKFLVDCDAHESYLADICARGLQNEKRVMSAGQERLRRYMETSRHPGNCSAIKNWVNLARESTGHDYYCLVTAYFSASYFSTKTAIQLDALRFAIDHIVEPRARARFLSAWLCAANMAINAPGHSAQFLKPTSDESVQRILKNWRRDVHPLFLESLNRLKPLGSRKWRTTNRVSNYDALSLLTEPDGAKAGVVYADPPYTKDNYDRYYHVYETLYEYAFPACYGIGRYPRAMTSSGFTRKTEVRSAFDELARRAAHLRIPLVVSYPERGLAERAGVLIKEIFKNHYADVTTKRISHTHSSMAGGGRVSPRGVKECIYVCK